MWALVVQDHTTADFVETAPADGYMLKREAGQLLLMHVPGS